jgi:hypothetical protein
MSIGGVYGVRPINPASEYMKQQPKPKEPGQATYEADLRKRPAYHDGKPRKPWGKLGRIERLSWERGEK